MNNLYTKISHRRQHPALPDHLEQCVSWLARQPEPEPEPEPEPSRHRTVRGRKRDVIVEYQPDFHQSITAKGFPDYASYAPPEDEWRALYKNNSVNSSKQTHIKGMREHHVKRYITNGRTILRALYNSSRLLHRDGKVTHITGPSEISNNNQRIYTARVLSQRTNGVEYAVQLTLKRNFTTFKSTRDIEQSECECLSFQNSVYEPPICKHISAAIYGLIDKRYP